MKIDNEGVVELNERAKLERYGFVSDPGAHPSLLHRHTLGRHPFCQAVSDDLHLAQAKGRRLPLVLGGNRPSD
jgi:hypothetical protein